MYFNPRQVWFSLLGNESNCYAISLKWGQVILKTSASGIRKENESEFWMMV